MPITEAAKSTLVIISVNGTLKRFFLIDMELKIIDDDYSRKRKLSRPPLPQNEI